MGVREGHREGWVGRGGKGSQKGVVGRGVREGHREGGGEGGKRGSQRGGWGGR